MSAAGASVGATITLSLVSHTNAGKTTLARTLLARDVGEVRDAPHVTTEATAYPLVATPGGDRLLLWDTPGFGDSARLARRLATEGNPIGWFLGQVWDRFRDRPFWLTQQAVRTVRDHTDVVLYLANAAEDPRDAGYLEPELRVLAWMGKPVLVLLNQTGRPRAEDAQDDDVARWQAAVAAHAPVRGVLAFDAFARCWVQEFVLFAAIAPLLAPAAGAAYAGLVDAWRAQRVAQLDAATTALAQPIAAAICAKAALPRTAMLRKLGTALGVGSDETQAHEARAARELSDRLTADLRTAMAAVIAAYGLSGRAVADVEARVGQDLAHDGPVDEGKAAAVGGVLSGAMTGLAADLAAGGLTFGAGMLTGALLGALGGAGAARAFNVARGQSADTLRWDDAFLERLVVASLLRYLAVAHYGRGRGDFVDSEYPPHWRPRVEALVAARRDAYLEIFALRGPACDGERAAARLAPLLRETTGAILADLYPAATAAAGLPAAGEVAFPDA
jgi:hypothetical protein